MQPAGGLGDRAAHRRVDRERLGQLVGGQRLRDRDRDRVDQLGGARADHHAADDDAGAGPAEQLHEAVVDALHLGAGVARQRQHHDLGLDLARVDGLLRPADGGDLGGGEDVGGDLLAGPAACTASPRKCHIAIRPCMAATEASISTPVQSPAAYTPRAEVRETRSTLMKPPSSRIDAGLLEAESGGVGDRPEREDAVRALDGAAVGERDGDDVAGRGSPTPSGTSTSTVMPRRVSTSSSTCGGVGVLAGQHPVAARRPG